MNGGSGGWIFRFFGQATLSPTNSNVFFEKFFQKVPKKVRVHSNEQHLLHDLCNDIRKVKRPYFSPKLCTVAREVKFLGGNRVVEDVAERESVFTVASSELVE